MRPAALPHAAVPHPAAEGDALDRAVRGARHPRVPLMALVIESPAGADALTEFVLFHDVVHRARSARWTAFLPLELPFLQGESPFAHEREVRPLCARERGEIVARAVAVVDAPYNRHWRARLGHVVMFEALPDTRDATRRLLDEACDWLAGRGAEAIRLGFG